MHNNIRNTRRDSNFVSIHLPPLMTSDLFVPVHCRHRQCTVTSAGYSGHHACPLVSSKLTIRITCAESRLLLGGVHCKNTRDAAQHGAKCRIEKKGGRYQLLGRSQLREK